MWITVGVKIIDGEQRKRIYTVVRQQPAFLQSGGIAGR